MNASISGQETGITFDECGMNEYRGYPLRLPYLAVFICLKGRAIAKVNFRKHLLRPSDVLVLSEDSLAVFSAVSTDFRLACIRVEKEPASEIAYKLPNRLFPYLWQFPLCTPAEEERELLSAWLVQVRRILQGDALFRRTMAINHLQNLFLYIAGRVQSMPADASATSRYTRKEELCWKFWDLIGKNCRRHRDVAFYADELHITPFYLSQLTKDFLNDTPKGLIERQVVLEMKKWLTTSSLSVKEMADRLNFEDASYMNRFFKRHTGLSLTEYRRRHSG